MVPFRTEYEISRQAATKPLPAKRRSTGLPVGLTVAGTVVALGLIAGFFVWAAKFEPARTSVSASTPAGANGGGPHIMWGGRGGN